MKHQRLTFVELTDRMGVYQRSSYVGNNYQVLHYEFGKRFKAYGAPIAYNILDRLFFRDDLRTDRYGRTTFNHLKEFCGMTKSQIREYMNANPNRVFTGGE